MFQAHPGSEGEEFDPTSWQGGGEALNKYGGWDTQMGPSLGKTSAAWRIGGPGAGL